MAVSDSRNTSPDLRAALALLTVDELKRRLALLEPGQKSLRKPELVAAIQSHLEGKALAELWQRLDETQQLAVAETPYATHGTYHGERFVAKYGKSPLFGDPVGSLRP